MRRSSRLLLLLLAIILLHPPSSFAATTCGPAIADAQRAGRLPAGLLNAVAMVESGRVDPRSGTVQPWPWTINVAGQGYFFPTKALAVATVADLQALGVQSIDVGCMQINLMYHPAAFRSLDQAFDPQANARYAARFLTLLYDHSGDWTQAVAAYHSQTPTLGASYRTRVLAHWHPPAGVVPRYADFRPRDAIYGDFRGARAAYADFSAASISATAGAGAVGRGRPAVPGRSGGGF